MSRPADCNGPEQLSLLPELTSAKRRRYVKKFAGDFSATHAVLDALLAAREGLKPYEGRCPGCGKIIASKAPHCGRRWCTAVFPQWGRDQRKVTAEALRAYGGLQPTDVTLPGTPERERHRCSVALPWAGSGGRVVDPKALYKANRRFKRRLRWLKRQAYNDARAALRQGGYEFDRLPPVLVGNLEVQKRGALTSKSRLPTPPHSRRIDSM